MADAAATSLVDGDRTRVVAGGPPSVPRAAAVSPATVTSRAATQPPATASRRPLLVAVIALVVLIGVGGLLMANGVFNQREATNGGGTTNVGNPGTSTHTAESPSATEESQPDQRDSSKQHSKVEGTNTKGETSSVTPTMSQSTASVPPVSGTNTPSSDRSSPPPSRSSSSSTPPDDNTSPADDPSKAGS